MFGALGSSYEAMPHLQSALARIDPDLEERAHIERQRKTPRNLQLTGVLQKASAYV